LISGLPINLLALGNEIIRQKLRADMVVKGLLVFWFCTFFAFAKTQRILLRFNTLHTVSLCISSMLLS
jgi:hypothetical protein